MTTTFEWHVEFLQTDPSDDNFIKFITCGIYGTENNVTKKLLWKVPFSGQKSDIPVDDWKSYADLMEGPGMFRKVRGDDRKDLSQRGLLTL